MPTPNPPHIEPPYPPERESRTIEDRPFTTPRPGSARGRGSSWIGLVAAIAVVLGLVFWFGSWSGGQKMAYNSPPSASTQNPPIPQPAPGTQQPPPTKP